MAEMNDQSMAFAWKTSYVQRLAILFVAYVFASKMSLILQAATGMGTHIWLGAGIALAGILIWGPSVCPAVFFGALTAHLLNHDHVLPFIGPAVGDTIEPLVGAYFCTRGQNFHWSLDRLEDIGRLILGAALLGALAGTLFGPPWIWYTGYFKVDFLFPMQYWAGDAIGILIMAPLILVFITKNRIKRFAWSTVKPIEFAAFVICSIGSVTLYFLGPPHLFLFFPLVLWAALRLGQRGATVSAFFIAGVVIWHAANRIGSVGNVGLNVINEFYLLVFVASLQMTGLFVAGVVTQREIERLEKEEVMRNAQLELEKLVLDLKRAKLAAEAANEAKSAFIANVSHEIRTPLGAVLGFSEMLLSEKLPEAERAGYAEVIRRNGSQLSSVINDILDLSKIEVGKLTLNRDVVAVEDVFDDIELMMKPLAVKKDLNLTVTREGVIPQQICTDRLRLRQIIVNVVGNAIKFTERGSINIKIKTTNALDGKTRLAFVVSDTGMGIPKDKVATLFKPFSQADNSTTRRFGGTGLGLILSQKLANSLGGNLILSESEVGRGSEFIITIDPGQPMQNQIAKEKTPDPTASTNLGGRKILLVDDNADNLLLIKHYLKLANAEVVTAGNGLDALDKIAHDRFDIVVMDLQMPTMDGYEATQRLRDLGYKSPIIALTAHAMTDERGKCLANGFDDYVTKPVERELLLHTLTKFSA
jgi:signal transduction histidine kinase/CheY-like chemotaxis protein